MADEPIITTGMTSPPPTAGAEEQQRILSENRTVTLRDKGQGVAILPGGRRVSRQRYMYARYTMQADADILGNPESMLNQEWKSEHPGWKYQWPIRQSNHTAAFIRAGWFVPVPYEAIDNANPMAAIADIVTAGGRYIVWKTHILVAVHPKKHDLLVSQYEDYAIDRTVNNAADVEAQLARANPGYDARVDAFVDKKNER